MRHFFLICLASMLVIPLAYAVKVSSLYETAIPVASQSSQDRAQAIPKALEQVLMKTSGNLNIANNLQVQVALKQAENLVEEYSYQPAPASVGLGLPYLLMLSFDRAGVNRLLKKTSQPVWGGNRPLILVWLVATLSTASAEIVTEDSAGELYGLLKQSAEKGGLPVIFPVMDMDDLNQVSVQDVAAMSLPTLIHASQRYAPDALLIGNLVAMPQGFQSQWKYVQGRSERDWTIAGPTAKEVVSALMMRLNTTLTQRYVAQPMVKAQPIELLVTMQVNGVAQSQDLNVLLRSVKQITGVENVQVVQVSSSAVWLEVDIHTALENFMENVALIPYLAFKAQGDDKLVYDWDR